MEKRLYITTNLVNGKVYAGKHHWKYGSKYLGSGYALKKAFNKYGKENFQIRWLKLKIYTPEDLDRMEIRLIRLLKYRYGNKCYNIQKGGSGGYFSFYMSDEEKREVYKKISEGKKRQYANGLTTKQIEGRIKMRETRSLQMKDPKIQEIYKNSHTKRIISLRNRKLIDGETQGELNRKEKIKKNNTISVTYRLVFPDNTSKIETKTINTFINDYNTDWNIFVIARYNGKFTFKRRTSRTKHPFPENTELYLLSENKGL